MKKILLVAVFGATLVWIPSTYANQCVTKTFAYPFIPGMQNSHLVYDANKTNFIFLNDRSTFSGSQIKERAQYAVYNGIELPTKFFSIDPDIKISPNGKVFAFVARLTETGSTMLYRNGKAVPGTASIIRSYNFSADGSSLYYASDFPSDTELYGFGILAFGSIGEIPRLYKDGVEVSEPNLLEDRKSPWYSKFVMGKLIRQGYEIVPLHSDSYRSFVAKGPDGKSSYFIDGKRASSLVPWKVPWMAFSNNGNGDKFYAITNCKGRDCVTDESGKIIGSKSGYEQVDLLGYGSFLWISTKKTIFVYRGKEITGYAYNPGVVESSDGSHYLMSGMKLNKDGSSYDIVSYDGKEIGRFDHVQNMTFSPSGEPYFIGRTSKGEAVFKGKAQVSKWYEEILGWESAVWYGLQISGTSLSFAVKRDGKKILVTDGKEEEIDNVYSVIRSENGKHEAKIVWGKNWKRELFFDGKKIGNSYEEIRYVTISPNGSRVAFFGKTDSKNVVFVIDGKEEGPYLNANITDERAKIGFSSDSKEYAYSFQSYFSTKLSRFANAGLLVRNGKETFENAGTSFEFLNNGKYPMFVWRGYGNGYLTGKPDTTTFENITVEICKK